jgi:HSP20 family protein
MLKVRDNLFDVLFSGFDFGNLFDATASMDFFSDEKSYTLRVTVPGFEEKDLSVQVNANILTVVGKHEKKESEKDKHFFMQSNSFSKSYPLPEDSLPEEITADYKAGVLVVNIPRTTKTLTTNRQIPIKVS